MVLTTKVGKKRSFAAGLLLTIVTFGIYRWYWSYKAHDELFRQYELEKEGKDEGIVWLILGILIPVIILVYDWKFVENLVYVRERMRLPRQMTPGKFIAFQIAGFGALFVGIIAAIIAIASVNIPTSTDPNAAPTDDPIPAGALRTVFLGYGLGILGLVVISAIAYYQLQRDINETWDWYDAHITALAGGAPPAAPPYAPQMGAPAVPPAAAPYPPMAPPPPSWPPPQGPQDPPQG